MSFRLGTGSSEDSPPANVENEICHGPSRTRASPSGRFVCAPSNLKPGANVPCRNDFLKPIGYLNEVELSELRTDANAVDNWLMESQIESKLDADVVATRVLAARLGSRTMTHKVSASNNDSGVTDRLVELLTGSFWRPVVAASMPLAIGIVIGATTLAPDSDWMMAEQYAFALVVEE